MGCDAVGRAVNFDSKDPQFESRPSLIREWPLISATRFGFFERSQWKIFSQPKPKFWADLKMSLLRWKLMCPLLGHFCKHLATFYFKIWSHWPMYTECTIMKRLNWKSLHLYQELLMTGQRDSNSNREIQGRPLCHNHAQNTHFYRRSDPKIFSHIFVCSVWV